MSVVAVFKRGSGVLSSPMQSRWRFFLQGTVRRPVEGKDYVQVREYPFFIPYGGMQP